MSRFVQLAVKTKNIYVKKRGKFRYWNKVKVCIHLKKKKKDCDN